MKAILVSVDYGDILSLTLPHNKHHFTELMVVTSSEDKETQAIAKANDVDCFITDSFYWDGAVFNKWRALERAWDAFGRKGWQCVMDADVLWPKKVSKRFKKGILYSPWRRVLKDIKLPLPPEEEWDKLPYHPDTGFAGYTQIFHSSDTTLPDPPWHEINWAHAGGADTMFQNRWPKNKKVRPDWEVLHLGPPCKNWCGRTTSRVDGKRLEDTHTKSTMLRHYMQLRNFEKQSQGDKYKHERIKLKDKNVTTN